MLLNLESPKAIQLFAAKLSLWLLSQSFQINWAWKKCYQGFFQRALLSISNFTFSNHMKALGIRIQNIKSLCKNKLCSLHYRLLRTVCRDFKQKYLSANFMIKSLHDNHPNRLFSMLRSSYFWRTKKGWTRKIL